jgi:epoxyqueuosine reductase QueG
MILEIESKIRCIFPNILCGCFPINRDVLEGIPAGQVSVMSRYEGWSIFAFAIPITDDGLWVWHKHGDRRYLMANYVLHTAATSMIQHFAAENVEAIELTEVTGQSLSMVEIGERARIGRRGWNNLLLHPEWGSWLQIHALLVDYVVGPTSDMNSVCIQCGKCIDACPVSAITPTSFAPRRCSVVVAAPWIPKSRAKSLSSSTYIECRECISSCPIGKSPEALNSWQR